MPDSINTEMVENVFEAEKQQRGFKVLGSNPCVYVVYVAVFVW